MRAFVMTDDARARWWRSARPRRRRGGAPAALPVAASDPRASGWRAAGSRSSLSRPMPARRAPLSPTDRAYLAVGRTEDVGVLRRVRRRRGPLSCRPTTSRSTRTRAIAHRTSPTNIGLGLLATLAAHDLGFIDTADARRQNRRDAHDHRTARAVRRAPAQLVRHADAGAAAAGLRVHRGQRQPGGRAADAVGRAPRDRAPRSPRAPTALFDAMNFRFLFDPKRQLFAIGYRLADADGPGRLDASYYDLLASEARLASFLAIAKGDVPEMHWFHLGRSITSVRGAPVLLSWSATLFEYLMPLLVMRGVPEHAARRILPAGRPPPDGLRRRARRAVGHLGVGLQPRRSARQLSVQGVRRPRARLEARPRRRSGRGAVRDRARRHDRSGGEHRQPAAARRGGARGRLRLLRRDRLHASREAGRRRPTTAGRAWSFRPTWRITRA